MPSEISSRLSKQQGINLVEVMVTLVITSIGLLGLSSLQLQSIRAAQDSGGRAQAIWIVNDIKGRIQANEISRDNYINANPYSCDGDTPGGTTVVSLNNTRRCSAIYNGGVRLAAVADCTGADQAAFDIADVLCGNNFSSPRNAAVKSTSSQFLSQPRMSISSGNNQDVIIELSWNSLTTGSRQENGETVAGYVAADANTSDLRSQYRVIFHP